jgi:UDPglucose 6-dehydrogenase
MRVGIVGYGFVGKAVASAYNKVMVVDPAYPDFGYTIDDLKEKCKCIFICVPTPPAKDGTCDTTILEQVIADLKGYTGIVISKCTANPITYERIERESELNFAHVPEFLIQSRAEFDYQHPHKIVIGCKKELRKKVSKCILTDKVRFNSDEIEFCTVAEASFFKYMANTMLAMKVIINNEYKALADSLNIDYEHVADIACTDARLGYTHWDVPGPDLKPGFGGACFPKDTEALLSIASNSDVQLTMLANAVKKNKQYRK